MSVFLVRPSSSSSLDFGGSIEKSYGGHELELGLLYLVSYLKSKNIPVDFVDLSLYENWPLVLKRKLEYKKYNWAGLTAYTNFITTANEVAGLIKEYQPGIKTVIGGSHASALPEETLREFPNFDFLIYGEGEEALAELINAPTRQGQEGVRSLVWRKNGQIIKNPPREPIQNLDRIPFPDRDVLDIQHYVPPPGNYHQLPSTAILSSRGCPFKCTFCARTGTRYKNLTRYRSVENILEEIKFCAGKYGIHDFRFYDDTFVLPASRLKNFCQKAINQKLKISWNCYSRVDTVNSELLKLMKKAGCYHIKYGVEFGTQKWLDKTKKNTTLGQARFAIRNTKKIGIAAKASFVIGMPGETKEEVNQTIKFARELNSSFTTFGIFTPLPGSELFDELEEQDNLLNKDWDAYFNKTKEIVKNQLDLKYLAPKVREAYRKVYLSPRYFLHRIVHLIRNFSLTEIKILLKGLWIIVRF